MTKRNEELRIEYQFEPVPDAEERYNRALDLVIELILQDYEECLEAESLTPEIEE